jgi:hypothetical protein
MPMYVSSMDRIKVIQSGMSGLVRFAGWLFTLGYLKLAFWQGALALVIWPYYIGVAVAGLHH